MKNTKPSGRKWSPTQNSDIFGDVIDTRNINFDNEGFAKLSGRFVSIYNNSDDGDFDMLVGARYFDGFLWFVTDDDVFTATSINSGTISQNTDEDVPVKSSDTEFFNGHMYVSTSTSTTADLKYRNASTNAWVDLSLTIATMKSGYPVVLKNFVAGNKLAIGAMNVVKLLQADNNLDGTNALTIPADFAVLSMDYNAGNLYIGTKHLTNGEAYMYVWNGTGTAAQYAFPVGASEIMSLRTYPAIGSVVVLTSAGQLLKFTGNGFSVLGNFPFYYDNVSWDDVVNKKDSTNKNMTVDGDILLIGVGLDFSDGLDYKLFRNYSGIWCYDPAIGLYNKYSVGGSKIVFDDVSTGDVDIANNQITVASGTYGAIVTGTPFMYDAQAPTIITGLTDKKIYFTIKTATANTIKIATTRANALAGTAVDISGTGSAFGKMVFFPEKNIADLGAYDFRLVTTIPTDGGLDRYYYNRLVCGGRASISSPTGDQPNGLFVLNERLPNVGHITFSKELSSEAEDLFHSVLIKYSDLYDAEDKIIVKYSCSDVQNMPLHSSGLSNDSSRGQRLDGTWTDSDTLTSTETILSNVLAGDEITIAEGSGGGYIRKISSITLNAGTYTIELDEALPHVVANETCRFTVERWTELGEITSADTLGYKSFPISKNSKFIQIKLELRGYRIGIEDVSIISEVHKPAI